jgi:Ni,Fe-hydrogenase III large subunit
MSDLSLAPNAGLLAALSAILPPDAFLQDGDQAEVMSTAVHLPDVVDRAVKSGYALAGIAVEWENPGWLCRYVFYCATRPGFVHVSLRGEAGDQLPSISPIVFAADWPEREIEDLFEIPFEGHPLLGDFVLHNEDWPEGVAPMRPAYGAAAPKPPRAERVWRPQRFVDAPGAFSMSVGPVYAGIAESAQFRLESEGEQILHATPRLFYKYRGLEKIAEGQRAEDVLLLAERLSGTSAVGHALAFAQAAEAIAQATPPPRALALRLVFAELERLRSHLSTIEDLVESTGLQVPTAMLGALVEDLLRLSGRALGHRYLFGLVRPGGVAMDVGDTETVDMVETTRQAIARLARIVDQLAYDNGFLDRVEEVGSLPVQRALHHGVVGPVGRASGLGRDLRAIQPYGAYGERTVRVALAQEGDAYARLRVLAAEATESQRLLEEALGSLPPGEVRTPWRPRAGSALGWSEVPLGAAFHWLRLSPAGKVVRWRVMPPSFANWPALATAVEGAAFQDFPIILASFGLSAAESDR